MSRALLQRLRSLEWLSVARLRLRMMHKRWRCGLRHVHRMFLMNGPNRISRDLIADEHSFMNEHRHIGPGFEPDPYFMPGPRVAAAGADHVLDKAGTPIIFAGRPPRARTVPEADSWIGRGAMLMAGVRREPADTNAPAGEAVDPPIRQPGPSRPKVAVVYHFFAHYREPVMRELLASGRYEFIAVGDREDPMGEKVRAWGGCPEERFVYAPFRRLPYPLGLQRGLLRLAMRRDLQGIVYLGNVFWPCTWMSAVIARATGKRVLFWTHGWTHRDRGLIRLLRRTFYRLGHGLLLYGHRAKMIGMDEGFAPERLHVIYNSLDYERQKEVRAAVTPEDVQRRREKLFPGSQRPMVICTTRLTPVRQLDQLLEAMGLLKKEGHEVDLLLVGDGAEKANLQRQAAELDLSVHFFGACYDERIIGELVMSANVAVSPGKVGLTAMHSMVFGTPVITHNDDNDQAPEWEAIIPGRTGDLFQRDNVADLARVIKRWTGQRFPDESHRAACYAVIDRFYNPSFQRLVIERSLEGRPADDLFWLKEQADEPAP
jgi:glycosyltransferase involved in cell wall biosynthesis